MKKNESTARARAAHIMSRAHKIAREITAENPGDCYAVNLAAALRLAWSDYAVSARAEWDRMSDTAQYDFLVRMVWHMKRRDCGTNANGKECMPVMDWVISTDDALAVAHDAFCRLPALFDKAEEQETPPALARVLAVAVLRAARYIKRRELKHANALRHTVNNDGEELDLLDISAKGTAEPIAPGPEAAAILRDQINRAIGTDPRDVEIARLAAAGLNGKEIAVRIGISPAAVTKRRIKMRNRFENDND